MERMSVKVLLTGMLCLIWAICMSRAVYGAKKEDFSATLTNFKGSVALQKPDNQIWLPVEKGMPLEKSDRLKTGAQSFAEILIDDGSLLRMEDHSEIVLKELTAGFETKRIQSTIYLKFGTLMSTIAKFVNTRSRFSVRTPTMVAGVRGTEFVVVVAQSGKTELAVIRGRVSVGGVDEKGMETKGPEVIIMGGMQTLVRKDGSPLPPAALQGPMLLYRNRFVGMRQRAVEMGHQIPAIRNRRLGVYERMHRRWEQMRRQRSPHGVIPGAPPPSGKGRPHSGVIPGAPPPSGRPGSRHGVIPGAPPPSPRR
jgi:hypothetical protein